jgi:hypothetical protein
VENSPGNDACVTAKRQNGAQIQLLMLYKNARPGSWRSDFIPACGMGEWLSAMASAVLKSIRLSLARSCSSVGQSIAAPRDARQSRLHCLLTPLAMRQARLRHTNISAVAWLRFFQSAGRIVACINMIEAEKRAVLW